VTNLPLDPLLTVADAAAILRMPRSTIYEWCRGGMPHYKLGRHIRFDERLLAAWVESRRVGRDLTPPTELA
jgi:excisionase family DNA binding protein